MRSIPSRYMLSNDEYWKEWRPVQKDVFRIGEGSEETKMLPDRVFNNGFSFSFINSGYHINREDFLALKRALKDLGEEHFVIVEAGRPIEESIQLKYPADIPLSDYTPYQDKLDNDTQFIVENFPHQFYLFGKRTDWGIFSSETNDLVVSGFKGEAKEAFKNLYTTAPDEVLSWFQHESLSRFGDKLIENYF